MTAIAILCGIAAVLLACYPLTALALKHVKERESVTATGEPEVGASLPTVAFPKLLYPDREHLFTASNGVELFSVGSFIDALVGATWYRAEKSDPPEFSASWYCYPGGEEAPYATGDRCAAAYSQWSKRKLWAAKESA